MLKVIDIASWQSVATAGMDGIDGVIVKTTEGVGYVNPNADAQYQLAKSKGRLLGIYHYANGLDPEAEAEYFYEQSKGYIGEAIPFLDWEAGSNIAWGDTGWCIRFVNHFHDLTGIWCGIYIQASALNQVANLVDKSPLWIAGYPTDAASWDVPAFPYSTAPWETFTLWQFTSGGNLDRNVANITPDGWKKIAKGDNTSILPSPVPPPPTNQNDDTLEKKATLVQSGYYGIGEDRKKKLGKYYTGTQAIVNHRINIQDDPIQVLVQETLAGKYGNGDERKRLLGSYFRPVQDVINRS